MMFPISFAVPTWLKDEQSLVRTKELVKAARPQDRVKVVRGTNQKNQLDQEAWKIVIKIMILQKGMMEEAEKEAAKIYNAASDAGNADAVSVNDEGNPVPPGAHLASISPQNARSRGAHDQSVDDVGSFRFGRTRSAAPDDTPADRQRGPACVRGCTIH